MHSRTHDVSRLDRLTTQALLRHHHPRASGDHSATWLGNNPEGCLHLATATIRRHGGMGRSYRHAAVNQHLFAVLWEYGRFYAPRTGWTLVDTDTQSAQLRWRHPDPVLPDVIDVLRTSGMMSGTTLPAATDAVVRVCNLSDRHDSVLVFPGEGRPVLWCPADDPIHSRELAVVA